MTKLSPSQWAAPIGKELQAIPVVHKGWHRIKTYLRLVKHQFFEDRIMTQAAAMAYNTLFSLIPTIVLAVLVLSMFGGARDSNSMAVTMQKWFFSQFGLDQIRLSVNSEQQTQMTYDLASLISEKIQNMRHLVQTPGTGLIGFVTLMWGSISLMGVIERAFNAIYRVTQRRALLNRLKLYWLILTLGPLSVAASLFLSSKITQTAVDLSAGHRWLIVTVTFMGGFVISWGLLAVFYKITPDTEVHWSSAILGSLSGGLLWEIGKLAFGLYLGHSVGFGRWYGNLALVPLFLMWIYLTWIFVLLGIEIAYVHQHFQLLSRRIGRVQRVASTMTDPRWIFPLGILLCRQFHEGETLSPEVASHELNLSPDVTGHLLSGLSSAGLVHEVQGRDKEYVLARPPSTITAEMLLNVSETLCHSPTAQMERRDAEAPLQGGMGELVELERQWSRHQTLESLERHQNRMGHGAGY